MALANPPAGGFCNVWRIDVWTTEIFPANETGRFRENFEPDAIALRAVDRTGNLSEPAIWTPSPVKSEMGMKN